MTGQAGAERAAPSAGGLGSARVRLPLARPIFTYVLLALIGAVFVAEMALGGSSSTLTLYRMGAQVNTAVAQGELWRLVAAMFLHIGLAHVAFNGWALYTLGRDVEAFYGSVRFLLIYFLAGLAGNVAYYVFGPDNLSAGASGAVFGLIGAEVAYFLLNRSLFGAMGRQRLGNLAVLIAINLVFGFTVAGINNMAHLGGLVAGLLLGLGLGPRYTAEPVFEGDSVTARLRDTRSTIMVPVTVLVAVVVLVGGVRIGNQRWQSSAALYRERAETAYQAGDLATAQTLLERAVDVAPEEKLGLFNLGVVYLQREQPEQAVAVLERARMLDANDVSTMFTLGVAYAAAGRLNDAETVLQTFLGREPAGERADYARQVLSAGQYAAPTSPTP